MNNKPLIYIIFITLFLCCNIAFCKEINNTGINYDKVFILEKKVKILFPIQINYDKKTKRKIVFEENIPQYMKTSGYWISKTTDTDKVILNKKEIKILNEEIYKKHVGISNLQKYSQTVTKKRLKDNLNNILRSFIKRDLVDIKGESLLPGFFVDLYNNIDIPEENLIIVKYAVTTKYNDVRLFPTEEIVISKNGYKDIDRLQEESIDLGTPVIILCQTKDKLWNYVVTPTEEGWIKTDSLAFTDRKTFNKWLNIKKLVVITESKTDIFTDKNKTKFLEYVRMGTKLPYVGKKGKELICVNIPVSDKNGNLIIQKGYLNFKDVNIGYLPYTQRNVLDLAFEHLNSPYGWGGARGEQDCSGYLGQIFNCFGILLPETSVQKIKCGNVIKFNKKDSDIIKNISIIENAIPGLTFIYLSGHIMLYIGHENNKPYVIHSIWGLTSYNDNNERALSYINKTIVSDLEIGSDVAGNSLIDRVSKFNIIK